MVRSICLKKAPKGTRPFILLELGPVETQASDHTDMPGFYNRRPWSRHKQQQNFSALRTRLYDALDSNQQLKDENNKLRIRTTEAEDSLAKSKESMEETFTKYQQAWRQKEDEVETEKLEIKKNRQDLEREKRALKQAIEQKDELINVCTRLKERQTRKKNELRVIIERMKLRRRAEATFILNMSDQELLVAMTNEYENQVGANHPVRSAESDDEQEIVVLEAL